MISYGNCEKFDCDGGKINYATFLIENERTEEDFKKYYGLVNARRSMFTRLTRHTLRMCLMPGLAPSVRKMWFGSDFRCGLLGPI